MKTLSFNTGILGAILAATLLTGGCATKKHVREAIAPVQNQVNDIDKRTNENKTAIGDLDRSVASTDEKATDAGKRASEAADAAAAANRAASEAGQRADRANGAAQEAQQAANQLNSKLDTAFQNLDNYRLVDTKQVFFRSGRSTLDSEAKAALDSGISSLGTMHNYVVEVEGFADRTGNKAMNLELSRNRADAVVRYLSVEHNVPLRDIRLVGAGADFPNAVNKTRADRKNNRRVDVKIYALDVTGKAQSATGQVPASDTTSADRQTRPVQ
jgi:outer membrane protein OmpA-like peptidoglycan-associated protein